MKSMTVLKDQFNKEDLIWKKRLDRLCKKIDVNRSHIEKLGIDNFNAISDVTFKEFMYWTDKNIEILKQMSKLDTEHKKFLLKWKKRFNRRIILDILFHGGLGA